MVLSAAMEFKETTPYTPQQNGAAERTTRTIIKKICSKLPDLEGDFGQRLDDLLSKISEDDPFPPKQKRALLVYCTHKNMKKDS
ncbi:hypothetical protein J437_LFUL004355 [Ladona fulva]|uniref:Integrase catalytic domain-containing protein n=1 Tax=Ladona fulva TaxID=123851 RepID=A0A8K0NXM2_LADFU|nr:hypothetical protein J437_LFUL004355 [Ladona fulva]